MSMLQEVLKHCKYCVALILTEPTYKDLLKMLEKITDWSILAAFLLDDDGSKTESIAKSNQYQVPDCRAAMIREYLKSGNVSWQNVLKALRAAGYTNLANEIENLFKFDP